MTPRDRSALTVLALFAGSAVVLVGVISATGAPDEPHRAPSAVGATAGEARSTTSDMPYSDCLRSLRQAAGELGVAPINIVETEAVRIVRYNTIDGSVLVTCSRDDSKMVVTVSRH